MFSTTRAPSSSEETYGFIGLGQMGYHMANNLYKNSGKNLVVYDINPKAVSRFIEYNKQQSSNDSLRIEVASSPREVAEKSSFIMTMLPESPHIKEAYLGEKGILSGISPGKICVDSSTIEPTVSLEVTKEVAKASAIGVDGPVSGGVMGAEAGTLTFMVGAPEKSIVERVEPALLSMGKNVVHCGDLGTGLIAKICNNLLLAVTMVGACEALHLGTKLGMDPKLLSSIMNISSGRSWTIDTANPIPGYLPNSPSSKGYEGGFAIKLILKDVGLAMSAAKDTKSSMMASALTEQIYRHVSNYEQYSNKDFSVLYKWLKENK
ncbi:hypothetical protein H4219_003265 [Mycoemilia scoparia]|uniref:3-hydroxyisobutyrate dehydrogenase n=1 Tax=Mycoemilia scoparia TaxID=417184 RepID=A0A9W7ZV80_9FUNG|nr:hypothetical protein H4219_003265 [Mycoemilia scoparia]